ncbi:MAG: LOG family protein, partial [Sedimentisphaerales bacterium]|nr:LOG family protein [Sedimentisphaerales bacterium]
ANPWIDKEIVTQDLYERLDTLIRLGDGYIALPGGTGTLLEIAAVWELINKQFLGKRPIIFLSDFWKPVMDTLARAGQPRPACLEIADDIGQLRSCLRRWFAPDRTGGPER